MSRRNPEAAEPVQKDINNPVQFGGRGPVISPQVTDPAALRYAEQVRTRGAVKVPGRYSTPVSGGRGPSIPRLDQPAEQGLSMADQATMQRVGNEAPPAMGGMFTGSAPPSPGAAPIPMSRPPAGILPIDILPAEAKEDPDFKTGQGSMYAAAQPALAYKYGVIRNNQRIPPQKLGQAAQGLSAKTLSDLQTIASLQSGKRPEETPRGRTSDDIRVEQESAGSMAGAAGRHGNAPSDGPVADPKASQDKLKDAVKKLDDFDFSTFRDMMMKDIINNEEQRDVIEKRCIPLEISDLVMRGFVTQRVPIIPGKLEPEYQSMTGNEDLAIKRLVMAESKGIEVSDRYLLDKFALMGVTIGLRAINGNVIPDHRDAEGHFNEEKFWEKFEYVGRLPYHMISSLGVNYFWFDVRVRKLFVADKLGNG